MRARICFYVCMAVAFFLTWRLYDVQALKGPLYAKEALAQRSDTIDVFARRGSILDRYGNVLVRSLPSESIYAVPRELTDPEDTARKLQQIFGPLDPAVVAALHDRHRWFVWIARKVSHDVASRVRALADAGVEIKEEDTGLRVDTAGRLASDLLGFVGTDENGLDGVEYAYDNVLRGRSGRITIETDEFGRPIPFGRERVLTPAQPGDNVELSIDPYVQFVAERTLAAQMHAYRALDGCAIVMDPWSGAVLAMASAPDFDPNRFWAYPTASRREGCVLDAYEPGSTFKLVTAAAALESGRIGLQTGFPARDTIEVGGRTIHNADDGFTSGSSGTETLGDIITYSHNVGAAEVALHLGAKPFYAMERRAGFGSPTQIGLAGENPGIVPPPAVWSGSSLPTMAFGQGVSVTPLAMARFYCAIANGGLLMQPRIVRAIYNQDGMLLQRFEPRVTRRVFSPRTADELRSFLRSVVVRGTGHDTAQIPGYATAGKTGTAAMVVDGEYRAGYYAASFIGMVPYPHARYVIYVKLERPIGAYYGSIVAGPAFAAIARAAMLHAGVLPRGALASNGE